MTSSRVQRHEKGVNNPPEVNEDLQTTHRKLVLWPAGANGVRLIHRLQLL